MTATLEIPQAQDTVAADVRRTWFTALLALAASVAMLSVKPASVSPEAYWVVSSIALATVLVVFVAGEHAWGQMVASARAAGVVGR